MINLTLNVNVTVKAMQVNVDTLQTTFKNFNFLITNFITLHTSTETGSSQNMCRRNHRRTNIFIFSKNNFILIKTHRVKLIRLYSNGNPVFINIVISTKTE